MHPVISRAGLSAAPIEAIVVEVQDSSPRLYVCQSIAVTEVQLASQVYYSTGERRFGEVEICVLRRAFRV